MAFSSDDSDIEQEVYSPSPIKSKKRKSILSHGRSEKGSANQKKMRMPLLSSSPCIARKRIELSDRHQEEAQQQQGCSNKQNQSNNEGNLEQGNKVNYLIIS